MVAWGKELLVLQLCLLAAAEALVARDRNLPTKVVQERGDQVWLIQ
jgi:hypothetical protein